MHRLRLGACLACLLAFTASRAVAADPPELRFELNPAHFANRSFSPIRLVVKLFSDKPLPQEGRLELVFRQDTEPLYRYVSRDLAISNNKEGHQFFVMVPPQGRRFALSEFGIDARFLSKSGVQELGSFPLRIPSRNQRRLTIGVVRTESQRTDERLLVLENALRLDRFSKGLSFENSLVTPAVTIDVEHAPLHGLSYCCYDLVILAGDALVELRDSQLMAIATWVEAGGSVFVVADRPVATYHRSFLDRLAGKPTYLRDQAGNLSLRKGVTVEGGTVVRSGLGRSVIRLSGGDWSELKDSYSFRRQVALLWKVRRGWADLIARHGRWLPNETIEQSHERQVRELVRAERGPEAAAAVWTVVPSSLSPRSTVNYLDLQDLLLAGRVEGVPKATIIMILVVFLIIVVPLDYAILGSLKRRRLTWVLLPVVSLLITWVTVLIAEAHMGKTDHRTSLTFVDVIEGNRIARVTKIELLFTATERNAVTQVTNALLTPIRAREGGQSDVSWSGQSAASYYGPGSIKDDRFYQPLMSNTAVPTGEWGVPLQQGQMPASCTFTESMLKWTPRISRLTTFQTDRKVPAIDFDVMPELAELTRQLPGSLCFVIDQATAGNRPELIDGGRFDQGLQGTVGRELRARRIVELLSNQPRERYFQLFSRMSPNGSETLEDLALVDTGSGERLLVIIVPEPGSDNFIVYRRLYEPSP